MNVLNIANKIKNTGYTALNGVLREEELNNKLSFLNHKIPKSAKGTFPIYFSQYFLKLLKFDFKKLSQSLILKKIAKDLKLKEISDEVFNAETELHMIDSYYSEKSDSDIITWHNDLGINEKSISIDKSRKYFLDKAKATLKNEKTSQSPRGLKFFIYLTDVHSNNGALAVIPNSNKIVKTVCKLILEEKIPMMPCWDLESLRRILKNERFKNLLIEYIERDKIEIFLQQSEFINEEKKDTGEFDLEMKKGSMVIFDELCVHRGSAPKKNSRIVLRYLFRKKL
tara:strand:+ start:4725 stop:5573 length:849 start_codon:yes stop_codon:yes gene_type:complete